MSRSGRHQNLPFICSMRTGRILGTEVLPGEHKKYKDMENVMFLCQDFVVFTDKKQKSREHWMMPPVSFPELTTIAGVTEVVSCSPSPPSDIVIKTNYDLEDDPKLASILVGSTVPSECREAPGNSFFHNH